MADNVLVRAQALGRFYAAGSSTVSAVADASFTVAPADLIALVGPSGSGKSTLLHLVAGIDMPSGGTIVWPGLGERAALRPGPIGVAFQGPSLLPPLTIVENVALPMILAGSTDGDSRGVAADLIDVFGLTGLDEKLPEELSGGQSQRAAVARAFAGSPRLVLADEPTGQQDRASAERLIDAMITLARLEGVALLIATHDPSVADRLEIRWSMKDGSLRTEVLPSSA